MREALSTTEVGVLTTMSPSDTALVERARSGDEAAYAELFARHRSAATATARRLAGPDRADDLVADAFTNVWRLLCQGKGPETGFRTYLLKAVRNAHLSTVRRQRREALTPDYDGLDDVLAVEDDHQARIDATHIGRAFRALPERWRTVLWLSAVERRDHADIARTLGITPNAVGVLAFRAREGLRETYLAEHLLETAERACRDTTTLLPSYVRGTLTARRKARVEEHLDECSRCSAALLDLESINLELGALLLLALPASSAVAGLGSGGAAGLSGSASASLSGTATPGAAASVGAGVAASTATTTAASIAASIAVSIAAAVIAVVGLGHLAEDLAPAVSAVPVAASLDGPSPERRDRPRASGAGAPATDGPATDGPAAAAPAAPPVAPPTPTPTPTPSAGAGLDEPLATPVDGREETLRTDQAATPAAPGTAPTTVPTTVPTAPPTEPQAPPVEPQAPAATALDPRLSAPQVRLDHAGTRATVTLPTADLSPGDTVVLTATHTLGAAVPAQGGWACRVSADWFDGHLWATHTVSCTWTGAAGAAPVLVTQYGLFGPGEITGTVTAAADGDPGDNTTSAPLG